MYKEQMYSSDGTLPHVLHDVLHHLDIDSTICIDYLQDPLSSIRVVNIIAPILKSEKVIL